ncbi:hypothetical protein GON26_01295 [Flavobacterium sp. GA093]|uniref:Lipoprotein n=1 Tax=Flavobacterium hydrocarbonoxydans TaxID=2683249 RepID=A0A6I4NP51_9FLAO|nr:hypothetical protein [Flavobacterium hydrocarbonoxydans]MWB92984.1 hypothetical protein [Flavobacterium hydrocarbonoxydans]
MKNSIKKTLCSFYFLFFVFLIGTFVACKSNSVPLSTKTEVNTVTTKVVVRDTVFEIKPDSSYYKSWLECIDGKVKIKGIPEIKLGNFLKPPNVSLFNNQLKVDCSTEAQRLFASWKDTYILENKQGEITIPVPYEKPLTYWQQTEIWCGRLFMVLVILGLIYFIYKLKKPI